MATKEQFNLIKDKLIQHIISTFPEDKKAGAIRQIQSMGEEQLKEFLIQNKILPVQESEVSESKAPTCIFCSIVKKELSAYIIDENKEAIAILEINPISKGHVIIVPKEHVKGEEKIPQSAFSMAKKISKKIKSRLKPREVKMYFANILGHEIINLLPIYGDENISSPRIQESKEELEKLQKKLEKKTKNKIQKPVKKEKSEVKEEKLWLPRRIP
ncbi:MAG TPA: HIT domain-containing protein [Candidatus Nanoarchaeia archaeon]|nr:HIT domain-containing protein [Candidatus Nanoarchaeia archaeon]